MTKAERKNYKIIKESRIERIAKGSGNTVQSVKDFISKFKQMEKMMTGMMGMFKGGGLPGMAGFPGMGGAEDGPMGIQNGFRPPGKKKPKKGKKGNPWGKGYF